MLIFSIFFFFKWIEIIQKKFLLLKKNINKNDYYKDGVPNALVGMCKDAFKLISFGNITDVNQSNFMAYYIFFAVIPFNLLLSLIVIGVTALVHKRLKILYDMI